MDELSQARLRELLHYDPDTGVFTWRVNVGSRAAAGGHPNCRDKNGYVLIRVDKRLYKAHRLAWLYVYGAWPAHGLDHINHIPSDNGIANLRDITHSQNMQNRGATKSSKSGIKGVYWSDYKHKWVAQIRLNYAHYRLGAYATKEAAAAAYKQAALKLHTHGAFNV